MMDYQQMRRIMHQKAKDQHKVDVFELQKRIEKQKAFNKFMKTMQYVLLAMLMLVFVGIITTNENAEVSLGERTLQFFKMKGWIE